MQTIQLQVEDDIYDEIKSKNIDINHKLQDFLYDLIMVKEIKVSYGIEEFVKWYKEFYNK